MPKAPVLEPWSSEPLDLETLIDTYVVEGKFAARTPGATLYLVHAKTRSGELNHVTEGQRFKLFIAPRLQCHKP